MNEALTTLAAHVARTLPDSLAERKRLLRSLEKILPERHPAFASVRAQLAAITAVEQLQQELPIKLEQALTNPKR